jgi:hypothetical protein
MIIIVNKRMNIYVKFTSGTKANIPVKILFTEVETPDEIIAEVSFVNVPVIAGVIRVSIVGKLKLRNKRERNLLT